MAHAPFPYFVCPTFFDAFSCALLLSFEFANHYHFRFRFRFRRRLRKRGCNTRYAYYI